MLVVVLFKIVSGLRNKNALHCQKVQICFLAVKLLL